MIKCENCHSEFRRRINRRNTEYSRRVGVADIDNYINEAYRFWVSAKVENAEVDSAARNSLRQLEVKNKSLSLNCHKNFYVAAFPDNYFRTLHYSIYGKKEGCKDCPKLMLPRVVQSDDLVESLLDPYRAPSFEYNEVLVDEAGDSLVIYTNNNFDIDAVYLSYYKKITLVACPKLTENRQYIGPSGDVIKDNVDFEISATYDLDDIIDIAVLYFLRDVGDNIELDTQLRKIQTKYQLFKTT